MPLNNSDEQTIPPNPDVRIYLHGQLILEPGPDEGECTVGVNRCSPAHQFSFEVRQRMLDPDAPDIILTRRLGTLATDIEIDVVDAEDPDEPANEGVTRFVPDVPFGQPQDFRWLLDLEGRNFHDSDVVINGADVEPSVIIREGLFYTASRTDDRRLRVTREGGGKDPSNLGVVAAIVGVNIYLRGRKVKVTYGDDALLLPPESAPANVKYYEIRITNDPPFVSEDAPVAHDEFREYYKTVKCLRVDGQQVADFLRFRLLLERIQTPGLGSPTIPCMPLGSGVSE